MTDTPDYRMFLKLMNLTQSDKDGEALNAIRMANAVLARLDQTWDDLLKGKIVMIGDTSTQAADIKPPRGVIYNNKPEIDDYFTRLYQRNLGTFKDWVDSVHEWWQEKGFLTEKQYQTLKKSALR